MCFGEPPKVTAVHAWPETTVIGDKVAGLDMVSFGPQIEAPHSPDERVSIPTVASASGASSSASSTSSALRLAAFSRALSPNPGRRYRERR
jgi:hypothetical protein